MTTQVDQNREDEDGRISQAHSDQEAVPIQVATPLEQAKELHETQGMHGNWNYDPYMHGMYNGMELVISILEGTEPHFKSAPEVWVSDMATNSEGLK